MSLKHRVLPLLPKPVEKAIRSGVYRRNCRLTPEEYQGALATWYRLTTGHPLDLENPQTLGQKIQWMKLYDSSPLKGRLADKFLVREWVSDRLDQKLLVPILGVWKRAADIPYSALPARFVLKATHGSRWNVIVKDKAALDISTTTKMIDRWLSMRTAMLGGFELHYEYCEPRVIAEEYLEDDSGGLRDYKFVSINGEPQFVLAIENRYGGERTATYDLDWKMMPFRYGYKVGTSASIPRPKRLQQMVSYARILSDGFPFARVDFYEVLGEVYFGEITFTPANGLPSFYPERYDEFYGRMLRLPPKRLFEGRML